MRSGSRAHRAAPSAIALALVASGSLHASPRVDETLSRAATLATRGESRAAAELYQALVDDGVHAADVHYNLGTLLLEEGDLGRAALHLETALVQDPTHDDARHNLGVVASARRDELDLSTRDFSLVHDVGGALHPALASVAFVGPFALLLAALAALAVVLSTRARARLVRAALVLGAASVVGLCVLLLRVAHEATPRAVVVVERAVARKAPADDAAVVLEAHAGLTGAVVDREGRYARLRLENGLELWLTDDALAVVDVSARAR